MVDFTSLCANGTAGNLKYEDHIVSCLYYDPYIRKSYSLKIKTSPIRSCFFSMIPTGLVDCAKPCIDELDQVLAVGVTGKYELFANQSYHDAVNSGYIVALGLRSKNDRLLASIRMTQMNSCFFAVPIRTNDDIIVEEIQDVEWVSKLSGECESTDKISLD